MRKNEELADGGRTAAANAGKAAPGADQPFSGRLADVLSKRIPGSVLGVYREKGFPLFYINERMLRRLGYESGDFRAQYGDGVLSCIHPGDRDRVVQEMDAALSESSEYEVQYRLRKKDGSYIWISETGQCWPADDGRSVCLGAFSDISREVEANRRLSAEIVEKENQARMYNHLFQSVLCGIVQYRLDANGIVVFENANREAIRIFGSKESEFWNIHDWKLENMIAVEDRDRILRDARKLRNIGDKNDYEYRLRRRDGSLCWIIGNAELIGSADGGKLVQSVFLDIDKDKRAEIENQLLSERVEAGNLLFQMALEHTTTCEFYYYTQERTGVFPERTCRQYHCREHYADMPTSFVESMVAEEWRGACLQMFDHIHSGRDTGCAEFKLLDGAGWCRITMSVVSRTEQGAPSFAVGIIEDITMAKEMELALEEAHVRDSLTGLYNRETGIRMSRDYMRTKKPEEPCALMLLDMDGFTALTREEGRVFADAVLQDVAKILQAETGPGDILTRLGGDEFMLLIKGGGKAKATIVGPRIAKRIGELCRDSQEVRISASIGMCATEVVNDYNGLYRCAESTLQFVKQNGKGRACCYLDTSNELGTMLTQIYTERYLFNEVADSQVWQDDDMVAFALELLGKSKRLDDALSLLLARIGKCFGLDRVTIAELDAEYLCMHYSFQWVRYQADSQARQVVYINQEQLQRTAEVYDEDGVSHYRFSEDKTLPSCMHIAIWDGGVYSGAMSFESRDAAFVWGAEQLRTAKELTKVISSFWMKARADSVSRAKTEFLSRMSHEIRTPMNAISGMTAIAKSVAGDREKTLECLGKIEYANSYLLALINDVLDMSRIESGKMEASFEPADLGELCEKLRVLLEPQAQEKRLHFSLENGYAEKKTVLADVLHLNQVLVNIAGNAIKFTEPGGSVDVRLSPEKIEANRVRIRFSVSDTGIGISESDLGRIFNAFEQANVGISGKYGGTGLGLAISSRLVQMMGGVLSVESVLGEGSTFSFTLTFAVSEQQLCKTEKHPPRIDFTGLRVLLAEDNELNREIAQTLLEMSGFQVETAEDGAKAVEMFSHHAAGYYDAVLMDIRMPVLDGLEATRMIRTLGREDSRRIPIIAMTANAFDEDSKKSLNGGMDGHLTKPIVIGDLLQLLGQCLA